MNRNDDIAPVTLHGAGQDVEKRAWQTPDMEIVLVSATASGRGALCEGSVFTNTS